MTDLSVWDIPYRPNSMRAIADRVAAAHNLSFKQLCMRTHRPAITHPRQEAMAAIHATGQFSYPQIGRFFGLDHSTVIHAIKAVERRAKRTAVAA